MPTRLLSSSVLKWPDHQSVTKAVHRWAEQIVRERPDVNRVGYFGSYATRNWGVGSDLDLIIIVAHSEEPFERRAAAWDTTKLPVPVDLLVYTEKEWQSINRHSRFKKTLMNETVWVYKQDGA